MLTTEPSSKKLSKLIWETRGKERIVSFGSSL